MELAINRVMYAYGLLANRTPEEEAEARQRLEQHLAGMQGTEQDLAVAGMRFLREGHPHS